MSARRRRFQRGSVLAHHGEREGVLPALSSGGALSAPGRAHARAGRRLGPIRHAGTEFASLYWGSGLCNDVPALAWYLLVSLVPLALGLTALATLALGDYGQAKALIGHATGVLPKDVHDQLIQLLLRTHSQSPLLIAVSLIAMVWVSSGAVGVIERCLLRLLGRAPQAVSAKDALRGKLRQIGLAAVLATVIVLIVISASAGTGLVNRLGIDSALLRIFTPLVALALCIGFCAGLYRTLSGRALASRAALAGGAVGGLGLLVTPTAAGYYVRVVADRTPVGVFLVLAGVVFTCEIVALGLLLGAGVCARAELGRPACATTAG
jgi:uncharacterized BrkB/YihY/UPF0761 family membrane protein